MTFTRTYTGQALAWCALLFATPSSAAEAPAAPPAVAAAELTVCDALTTEMDVLGKRMESEMIAMGGRIGQMANQAIADTQTHNAIQSQVGKLNWVVPGLGTALDTINNSVLDVKNKKRELQMNRERAAATLSVEQAVSRMVALQNELILNDCAQL